MQNFWQRTLHWNPQIYADTPSLTNWDLTPGFLHALEDFAETGDPPGRLLLALLLEDHAASELLAVRLLRLANTRHADFSADARIRAFCGQTSDSTPVCEVPPGDPLPPAVPWRPEDLPEDHIGCFRLGDTDFRLGAFPALMLFSIVPASHYEEPPDLDRYAEIGAEPPPAWRLEFISLAMGAPGGDPGVWWAHLSEGHSRWSADTARLTVKVSVHGEVVRTLSAENAFHAEFTARA